MASSAATRAFSQATSAVSFDPVDSAYWMLRYCPVCGAHEHEAAPLVAGGPRPHRGEPGRRHHPRDRVPLTGEVHRHRCCSGVSRVQVSTPVRSISRVAVAVPVPVGLRSSAEA
ncbi:MAG: hypothetical protein ACRDUV_06945 [Pseudonocardiaceae bacterium]